VLEGADDRTGAADPHSNKSISTPPKCRIGAPAPKISLSRAPQIYFSTLPAHSLLLCYNSLCYNSFPDNLSDPSEAKDLSNWGEVVIAEYGFAGAVQAHGYQVA
jgi:hypothetical protein